MCAAAYSHMYIFVEEATCLSTLTTQIGAAHLTWERQSTAKDSVQFSDLSTRIIDCRTEYLGLLSTRPEKDISFVQALTQQMLKLTNES